MPREPRTLAIAPPKVLPGGRSAWPLTSPELDSASAFESAYQRSTVLMPSFSRVFEFTARTGASVARNDSRPLCLLTSSMGAVKTDSLVGRSATRTVSSASFGSQAIAGAWGVRSFCLALPQVPERQCIAAWGRSQRGFLAADDEDMMTVVGAQGGLSKRGDAPLIESAAEDRVGEIRIAQDAVPLLDVLVDADDHRMMTIALAR